MNVFPRHCHFGDPSAVTFLFSLSFQGSLCSYLSVQFVILGIRVQLPFCSVCHFGDPSAVIFLFTLSFRGSLCSYLSVQAHLPEADQEVYGCMKDVAMSGRASAPLPLRPATPPAQIMPLEVSVNIYVDVESLEKGWLLEVLPFRNKRDWGGGGQNV